MFITVSLIAFQRSYFNFIDGKSHGLNISCSRPINA